VFFHVLCICPLKKIPHCAGVIAVANAMKDMGALSIANVMGNGIGKEQLDKLQEIMRSKPNLVSLCGIAGDATVADLSGLGMDANDAVVLASELPDKGAMTQLDVSGNNLAGQTWNAGKQGYDYNFSGIQALAAALPKCQ
jgi:hypothetical protein